MWKTQHHERHADTKGFADTMQILFIRINKASEYILYKAFSKDIF